MKTREFSLSKLIIIMMLLALIVMVATNSRTIFAADGLFFSNISTFFGFIGTNISTTFTNFLSFISVPYANISAFITTAFDYILASSIAAFGDFTPLVLIAYLTLVIMIPLSMIMKKIRFNRRFRKNSFVVAGPLTMDNKTGRAITTQGNEIKLNKKEYKVLKLLASNESKTHALERLCQEMGTIKTADGTTHDTSDLLKSIQQKIKMASDGFMWIEENDDGYSFQSKWGRR